jgi:TonB-dependent SusC/RagA subfamily outer membrane receptor
MKYRVFLSIIVTIFISTIVFGQKTNRKNTITGVVINADHKPIKGVIIIIDSIKTESLTNRKGYYKIKVRPTARNILVASPINGIGEEIINGRTTINFTLTGYRKLNTAIHKDTDENEIVDVGYTKMKKSNISSAITKTDVRKPKFSSYSNMYDMIRVEVPDVQVNGNSLSIRGGSSFGGSNEPLIIVDGIEVRQIDVVSPHDVKYITVLKGASATIYGVRGANGAILITTLRGSDK